MSDPRDPVDPGTQPTEEPAAAAPTAPEPSAPEADALDAPAAPDAALLADLMPPADAAPAEAPVPPAPDEEPSLQDVDPSLATAKVRSIVESLLFAADKPLTIKQMKEVLGERDGNVVRSALAALKRTECEERGLVLHEVAGGFQLRTHPDNAPWVARLLQARPVRLTRATLECLSIVAYRQPVTRADVEDVRGVDCGGVLKLLLDRNLVRILGRKEEPGRPLLYGTTKDFLSFFNLRDLRDLPTLRDFSELSEEHRLRVESLHGAIPEAPADETTPPPLAPGERPHLTLVQGGAGAAAEGAAPEAAAEVPADGGAAPEAPAEAPAEVTAEISAEATAEATPDATPDATIDATATDLAAAARAAELRAAAAAAAREAREARPEHEDAAAREARLTREREYSTVDDKLLGELESALKQAERIRREIDPPKPRAPRQPAPLPDGTMPPAEGDAPEGGAAPEGAEGAEPGDPDLQAEEPPDEEPPPVC
jgi:segregation and condensation protein B